MDLLGSSVEISQRVIVIGSVVSSGRFLPSVCFPADAAGASAVVASAFAVSVCALCAAPVSEAPAAGAVGWLPQPASVVTDNTDANKTAIILFLILYPPIFT
jgi:hypothetical protein